MRAREIEYRESNETAMRAREIDGVSFLIDPWFLR